jgi:hypothetical protein
MKQMQSRQGVKPISLIITGMKLQYFAVTIWTLDSIGKMHAYSLLPYMRISSSTDVNNVSVSLKTSIIMCWLLQSASLSNRPMQFAWQFRTRGDDKNWNWKEIKADQKGQEHMTFQPSRRPGWSYQFYVVTWTDLTDIINRASIGWKNAHSVKGQNLYFPLNCRSALQHFINEKALSDLNIL